MTKTKKPLISLVEAVAWLHQRNIKRENIMIRTRDSKCAVKIIKAKVDQEPSLLVDIETAKGAHSYRYVNPCDLVATNGFGEIERAIFRGMNQ